MDEYCNIVAKKNAEIVRITASNGTQVVKPSDTVKEGDILIRTDGWKESSLGLGMFMQEEKLWQKYYIVKKKKWT